MQYVMMNGQLTETTKAAIPVMDHGFLYGMGLFETFRTYEGKPSLLGRHLQRLSEGCEELGIPFQRDDQKLEQLIDELLEANGLEDGYLRYTVSAGEELLGLPLADYREPNHLLFAKALPKLDDEWYTKGKPLQLLTTIRNTPEGHIRHKSLHYMNNILAKREFMQYKLAVQSQAEGLMLTKEGHLAEGIVSNLFFFSDDVLYTPDTTTGILPGITREVVMEAASELGISVVKGMFTTQELCRADEVFMTSSIQELIPITALLGFPEGEVIQVQNGQMGPNTRRLLDLYRKKAGRKDVET
ncbi:aminotransferase class IV [Paenibacillus sp. Marseille-Q4541]|uniref:aminotransferase class IV n=1 Tax=Paenibacillus sp. Marseille-Q4541 TaxID=2831522 RepID=UPI001BAA80C5|nr:aminotransferase class IV [Paenibacillus sp. Marseille-Q4541]